MFPRGDGEMDVFKRRLMPRGAITNNYVNKLFTARFGRVPGTNNIPVFASFSCVVFVVLIFSVMSGR